jgi:hypothetical protein
VVLNLPGEVAGKRLRCPHCQQRFFMGPKGPSAAGGSEPKGGPASSLLLTERSSEPEMPRADRDLRDTFSPDLLLGEDRPQRRSLPAPAPAAKDDAAALFDDDGAPPRPRKSGAEARSKARRCPTCGWVVPAGMSLCDRCGLDLETGQRHVMDELLDDMPEVGSGASLPPIGVLVIGGLAFLGGVLSAVAAAVYASRPEAMRLGYMSLALIGIFGAYAAVQFLRGRSLKLLVVALLLGMLINIVGLIVLPIYEASAPGPLATQEMHVTPGDEDMPRLTRMTERVDREMWKVTWGIGVTLLIAGALVYLATGDVRRYFPRKTMPFEN